MKLLLLLACAADPAPPPPHSAPPPLAAPAAAPAAIELGPEGQPTLPSTTLQVGGQSVVAEIADTNEERKYGLMLRPSMPWDRGMLFVYPSARPLSFWMRNTRIPLSIAYLDAQGTIVHIADMKPLDTTPVPSGTPAMYALEMNQGWFEARGVAKGARIEGLPGPSAE